MSDASIVAFDPDALAARLPAGALRYLTHAIRPGAPIPHTAEISFTGQLRLRPGRHGCPFRPGRPSPPPAASSSQPEHGWGHYRSPPRTATRTAAPTAASGWPACSRS